jgi:hypothetical protein
MDPVSFYLAQVQIFRWRARRAPSAELAARHRRMADAMVQEAQRAASGRSQ